jgi:hypothetical protein
MMQAILGAEEIASPRIPGNLILMKRWRSLF